MRSLIALSMIAGASMGLAQAKLPTLGAPNPVDFRVNNLEWHPHGQYLVYARKEGGTGTGIGVYGIGADQGKVLVHLNKGDSYQWQWLEGQPAAVLITYHPYVKDQVKMTEIKVDLLTASDQTSRPLFDQSFDEKDKAAMEVDTSPSLLHAIFKLTVGKKTSHLVMRTGTQQLTSSPDLDAAEAQGLSGPSWSVDGTAVYANSGGTKLDRFEGKFLNALDGKEVVAKGDLIVNQAQAQGQGQDEKAFSVQLTLQAAKEEKLTNALVDFGTLLSIRFMPPAPPTGSTVLELMPQNATLRQVRFRGPWTEAEVAVPALAPFELPVMLEFGRSKGQAMSLWLTRGEQKKNDQGGSLIAASASQAWMAPRNDAVAYLTDGALFIRTIGPNK